MKGVGQDLDETAEINACIGNVVEDGFVAIALIFDIADFHVQLQIFGNLSTLNHRAVFAAACLFPLVDVGRTCFTVDTLDVGRTFDLRLFHLERHERPGEGDGADVVARRCLHGHNVAFDEVEMVVVAVVTLTRVLKLHFDKVGYFVVARHIAQIVRQVELLLGATTTAGRKTAQCGVGDEGF